LAELTGYRHSSYWHLYHPAQRPKRLVSQTALTVAGSLQDNPKGWRQYSEHLARELAESDKNKRRYVGFAQGWAIGSDAFKAATISKYAPAGSARAWTLPGAEQMRASQWELHLQKALSAIGRSVAEARLAPKSELWKLALATWMRDAARPKNSWLSDRLVLAHPCVLSRNLTRYRCLHQHSDPTWARLRSTFAT